MPVVVLPGCEPETWFARKDDPDRCVYCYERRLAVTADYAQQHGFQAFTTTLLVSPYQNQEAIVLIAQREARRTGVTFLATDFRPGFRTGQALAKADGLYRQRYCGCLHSLDESRFSEKIRQEHRALESSLDVFGNT